MNWSDKPPKKLGEIEVRTRTSFLIFPKKLLGETRWLEWASWRESRRTGSHGWTAHHWL